jgi:protease-4
MTPAAVDSVAQGRVWFGEDAQRVGLVDQIGGLDDAIAEARRRAGVPAGERIEPRVYGRPAPPLLQRLLTDRLAESWARTVAGPSLEPLQLRGMAEVEP